MYQDLAARLQARAKALVVTDGWLVFAEPSVNGKGGRKPLLRITPEKGCLGGSRTESPEEQVGLGGARHHL